MLELHSDDILVAFLVGDYRFTIESPFRLSLTLQLNGDLLHIDKEIFDNVMEKLT